MTDPVIATVPLAGLRRVRRNGHDVLDLHPALDAALAGRGLGGFLARPMSQASPQRGAVGYGADAAGLVPYDDATPEQRRGAEIALGRLVAAFDEPGLAGWLATALPTAGEAPLLTGPDRAVLTGWGLVAESSPPDLSGALAAGIGRYDTRLLERAGPYYLPSPVRSVSWPAAAGAGLLVGVAFGMGLALGWPSTPEPPEHAGLRAELARLQMAASGDVCRLPPAERAP